MNQEQTDILEKNFNIILDKAKIEAFTKWEEIFKEYNSKINLISKNDIEFIFEKHVYDSLSLALFFKKYKPKSILDIGTGGGFPSVPLAIVYDDIQISALDSTSKKINFINLVVKNLNLNNLKTLNLRVEDLKGERFDLAVSRAVSSFEKIYKLSKPHIKFGGYFVAYKSKNIDNELKNTKIEKISYRLPTEEKHERILAIASLPRHGAP